MNTKRVYLNRIITILCILAQILAIMPIAFADSINVFTDTYVTAPAIGTDTNWAWETTAKTGTAVAEQSGGLSALHIKSAVSTDSTTKYASLRRSIPNDADRIMFLIRFKLTEVGGRPILNLLNIDGTNNVIGEIGTLSTGMIYLKDKTASVNKSTTFSVSYGEWQELYLDVNPITGQYGVSLGSPNLFQYAGLYTGFKMNFVKLQFQARSTFPDGLYLNTIVATRPSNITTIEQINVNNTPVTGFDKNLIENDYYLPLGDKLEDFNLSSNAVALYPTDSMASVTKTLETSIGLTYIKIVVKSSDGTTTKEYRLNIKRPKFFNSYTTQGSDTLISTTLKNNGTAKDAKLFSINIDTNGNKNILSLTPITFSANEEKTISNTLPTSGSIVTMLWKDLSSFEPIASNEIYSGTSATQSDLLGQLLNPVITDLSAIANGDIAKVSGEIQGSTGQMVSIMLPDPDKGIVALTGPTPDLSAILYATQTVTQNGRFSVDVPVNYVGTSKNFKVYIGSANLNTPYEKEFICIPKSQRDGLREQVNNAVNSSALLDILQNTQNLEVLIACGLKMELYNLLPLDFKTSLVEDLYNSKVIANFSEDTLRTTFNNFVVMLSLRQAKSVEETVSIITTHNSNFQIPMQTGSDFMNLSSGEQAEFYNIIFSKRDTLETVEILRSEINNFILLAKVNMAVPLTIREIVESGLYKFSSSNTEIAYYNTIKSNAYKLSIIYGDILLNKYQTINALETAFRSAVNREMNIPIVAEPSDVNSGNTGKGGTTITVEKSNPSPPPVITEPKIKFTDITDVAWAKDAIDMLVQKDIVNGISEGIFSPNSNIKREELVKMVTTAFGLYDKNANSDFTDVSESDWSYSYISSALKANIIVGTGDRKFGIDKDITRQELATLLYRVVNIKGITLKQKVQAQSFDDYGSIGEYARQAVTELQKSDIIRGYENKFNPDLPATRAQAAKMIYELLIIRGDVQ